MRKLIAILLLTCLCFTLLGYHLVFNYQLASVKSEMKAFLKDQKRHKDVIQLSFKEDELKQLYWEEEKEFSFKGEMYDVIEKTTEGNHIVIRCIADKKETSLLNEYQRHNKNNSTGSVVAQLITIHFLLPADYFLQPTERRVEKQNMNYSFCLQNIASTVILPPPDVC